MSMTYRFLKDYYPPCIDEQKKVIKKKGVKSALGSQIGGNHYKDMVIQPVEFITANNLGFIEGCIIKYLCRYKVKGGVGDLQKAQHFLNILLEINNREEDN